MSDYDVYELSERERQVVFTALDLYREAAEKQQEANEKKVRVRSEEIAELLEILIGDDYRIGLLHKFMAREARERIAKERAERERRDREARAQMGLFSDGGGQTVEEALEGIEEEAKRKIADAEVSKQHGDQVEPAAAALDPDVERALKQALDGIDALLPHEDVQIGEDGGEPIIETRIAPVSDEDLTAALRGLWKGTVEKGMAISFRHYRTLSGAETHVFVVGGSFAPAFYFGVDREVHGFTKWEPTLAGAALLDAVRHVWGIPRPEAVDVQEATTEATDPGAEAGEDDPPFDVPAGDLDDSAGLGGIDFDEDDEAVSECLICGCDDQHACELVLAVGGTRPCAWKYVDREAGYGICDNPKCLKRDDEWHVFQGVLQTPQEHGRFESYLHMASDRTIECALRTLELDVAAESVVWGPGANRSAKPEKIEAIKAELEKRRAQANGPAADVAAEIVVDDDKLRERAESIASSAGYRPAAPRGSDEYQALQVFIEGFCTGYLRGERKRRASEHWKLGYDAGLTDRKRAEAGDHRARYPIVEPSRNGKHQAPAEEPTPAKPTPDEEHTIRSAAAHFFAGDEGAQRDYVAGAFDAIADRAVGDRLESHGQVSGAYVRGHSLGRTLLEKRKKAAAAAAPEQAAETSAPTTGADDAFAELVSALKGDSRPITDFAELLSPTLIAILRDHGITTVGHVAERWDELPGITGVGKVSLGRLRTLLQEASSAATAGAAASAGETDEDGDLPF